MEGARCWRTRLLKIRNRKKPHRVAGGAVSDIEEGNAKKPQSLEMDRFFENEKWTQKRQIKAGASGEE